MLVFTRQEGETFYVGENVEITMEQIENHQVRVSIKAPREVTVIRKELLNNSNPEKKREDIDSLRMKIKSK